MTGTDSVLTLDKQQLHAAQVYTDIAYYVRYAVTQAR